MMGVARIQFHECSTKVRVGQTASGRRHPLVIAAFLLVLVGAAVPAHSEAVASVHEGPPTLDNGAPGTSSEAAASWAGFGGVAITEMLSQRLGLSSATGVIVTFVHPEGPAAKAGLQTRDMVLQADGEPIADGSAWSEWVSAQTPGTKIELVVRRMGEEISLQLKIEELPAGVEPDGS